MKRSEKAKAGPKFRVGQCVKFTLEGPIEAMNKGYAYVRVVIRKGDHNDFAQAVLYLDELHLVRESGQRQRKGKG